MSDQTAPPIAPVPTSPVATAPPPPFPTGPSAPNTPAMGAAPVIMGQQGWGMPYLPPDPNVAVRIRGLTKRYGNLMALAGLDLDIPRGSLFGLIGPNGAGKTTTLSVIATLLLPTSGYVDVMGVSPITQPREVRKVMGYMPDVMGVNERLTVDEYLRFFAHAYKRPKNTWDATIEGLLELVNLGDKRNELVDSLSRGMKQRLSLARALIHEPDVLVLDEPASGLDPQARIELRLLLHELQGMGKTIIVSSHILSELEEMCSHVAIITSGRLATSGTTVDLSRRKSGTKLKIRLADGRVSETIVADLEAQRALLYDLVVVQQLPVVEFTQVNEGLEELFLDAVANAPAPVVLMPVPPQQVRR